MHHPERQFVHYGFSQVQPTKVFVEGTFKSHTLSLCILLSFMASRAKISSEPAVLLEYNIMEVLSCDHSTTIYGVTPRATTTFTGTSDLMTGQ